MLDNAVDLSFYPSEQARHSGLEHRAIGLGVAGFQEALARLHLTWESNAAADFAEWSTELVSCGAIMASAELARERGPFPSYSESKWRDGILPIDTLGQLSHDAEYASMSPPTFSQDWAPVRERIRRHGMRNGATTAISSLDTPARIAGVAPSIDSILDGEVIDPKWLIECAARQQKWIDLGQTLTLRTSESDTGKLAELYMRAWEKGIKTVRHHCLVDARCERGQSSGNGGLCLNIRQEQIRLSRDAHHETSEKTGRFCLQHEGPRAIVMGNNRAGTRAAVLWKKGFKIYPAMLVIKNKVLEP